MIRIVNKLSVFTLFIAVLFALIQVTTNISAFFYVFLFLSLYMILNGITLYTEKSKSIEPILFLGVGGLILGITLSRVIV
ncbi:hypothetical protein [Halobacillus salinus]|uniref:DUF3953 domain-containing protein n=1 Tax=Halobacillus salinus TaxID=192814 RepID=A0A4Z0H3E0_9BACI|nr:hypothetical protein [Halobacillus salinus]TGB04449.1 hypothetical protein E4663_05500 [Halobacillus salinus]